MRVGQKGRRALGVLLVTGLGLTTMVGCEDRGSKGENEGERPGIERLHFSTFHFCSLGTDGHIWCAGGNQKGQLGDGTRTERLNFVKVQGLSQMSGLALGLFDTSCAWNQAGELYCWGNNERGALGRKGGGVKTRPVKVEDLPPVESVTLGAYHGCALTKEQEVYCWGENREGQAGLGNAVRQAERPRKVEGLKEVVKIEAGAEHTCALDQRGSLFCWGSNEFGQLGVGAFSIRRVTQPDRVGLVPGRAVDLTVSYNHSCATFGERRVLYCWGANQFGQLGLDDLEPRDAPTEIAEMAYVEELASGGGQVCARVEGRVYCAGEVLRPVEVARQTGEGYLFRPSAALERAEKLWSGVLAVCGPVDAQSLARRGIEHQALR